MRVKDEDKKLNNETRKEVIETTVVLRDVIVDIEEVADSGRVEADLVFASWLV